MDPIRLVEFDVHATNPVNTIPGEKILLKDKTLNWVIPDGSPFFAVPAMVKVYNQAGGLLKLNTDYFFEGEFVPFCNASNKSVCSFIRVSNAVLAANTHITIDYQSIGAYFVPRSQLAGWMEKLHKGKVPIPWDKVFGMPETLPPALHIQNIKTEIGDWWELTYFCKVFQGLWKTTGASTGVDVDTTITNAYNVLKTTKAQYMTLLKNHDDNYHSPHLITKFDILMGNHPNFATATLAEDKAGIRADVLSTPQGIQELAKSYIPDTDAAMRTGIMPISKFGGESFIPPNISGAFEGLGSLSVSSAFCLEKSGLIMMLTSHNDGRNEGLYYSQIAEFFTTNPKITYTGYKYEAPSLLAKNFNPTTVVGGSNHRVIMVGDDGLDRWFVALTNGTLDATAHQYTEVNMAPVLAKGKAVLSVYANTDNRLSIHLMGDYVVLIISPGTSNVDVHLFFRIPVSKFKENHDILEWEQILLTYKNYENVQQTNVERFQPMQQVRTNGVLTGWGPITFMQPPISTNRGGKTMFLNAKKPNNSVSEYLFILQGMNSSYRTATELRNISSVMGTGYEFNPATGVFTEVFRNPSWTADYENTTETERQDYTRAHYYQFYDGYGQAAGSCGVILDSGEILMATSSGGNNFPAYMTKLVYEGRKTAAEVLSQRMDIIYTPVKEQRRVSQMVGSPLLSGVFPAAMTYEADGELYSATNPVTNTRATYFRKVSGPYAVRPEVTNTEVSGIKSRPLTNDIYQTNMAYYEAPIGITGSAAELTAGGVECGSTSLASMGYSSMGAGHSYPRSAGFTAPAANSMLISCARTFNKVLDAGTKRATYTPTSFYGVRKELIDKMEAMIPAVYTAHKPWSVCFHILGNEMGGMFKGLNLGIAIIAFQDPAKQFTRQIFVLFRPVVEAPNADHPDVHWIKDITVLDTSAAYSSAINNRVAEQNLLGLVGTRSKAGMYIYRDGNKLQIYNMNAYTTNTTATIYTRQTARFDVDIPTNKLENIFSYQASWSVPDLCAPIPKVGMSDVGLTGGVDTGRINTVTPAVYDYTGGAARLLHKTDETTGVIDWYIGPTVYPQTGWTLFFQDGIRMMINGTNYEMPGGSIDLRDIDPAPANKTFYVYATIEDDTPGYFISGVKLRKSGSMMLVGVVTTAQLQILSIQRLQPLMVGDFLFSFTREGGIIPISTGFPQDEGIFAFLREAELLP